MKPSEAGKWKPLASGRPWSTVSGTGGSANLIVRLSSLAPGPLPLRLRHTAADCLWIIIKLPFQTVRRQRGFSRARLARCPCAVPTAASTSLPADIVKSMPRCGSWHSKLAARHIGISRVAPLCSGGATTLPGVEYEETRAEIIMKTHLTSMMVSSEGACESGTSMRPASPNTVALLAAAIWKLQVAAKG